MYFVNVQFVSRESGEDKSFNISLAFRVFPSILHTTKIKLYLGCVHHKEVLKDDIIFFLEVKGI